MQSEEPTDKPTTIKLPASLKDELDAIKEDDQETYAGVITRIISTRSPVESTPDTITLSIPRKVYSMILMLLPNNMGEVMRKGVR